MKRKISSLSSSCVLKRLRRPRTVAVRNFWSFPRLVTSGALQHLNFKEKLLFRESSSLIRFHVDDNIRRELIRRIKSFSASENLTHEKILVLSIEQYTRMNFNPPYICTLIEKTKNISASCNSIWRELETPARIEDKEKLLRVFYDDVDKYFGEKEKKIAFTLTVLRMLKALSSKYTCVHPSNRKSCLRFNFVLENLFFAIPFYNYVFDWFSFDRDWIQILLLLTKFLEIKAVSAIQNDQLTTWVDFMRPMNFELASVIFGERNPFTNRSKSPSRVKCCFSFKSDRRMTAAIKEFVITEKFDWERVAKDFTVDCKFSTSGANVCKPLKSSRLVRL